MTPRAPYGIVPPLACELLNHFAFFWPRALARHAARARACRRASSRRACGGARIASSHSATRRARAWRREAPTSPGTDGSDHAFRQRVVGQVPARTRRRAEGRKRCCARTRSCAMAFAMCTALGAFATRGMRLAATFDSRTTATLTAGVLACALAAHGARAVDDKRGTGRDEDVRARARRARRGARSVRDVRAVGRDRRDRVAGVDVGGTDVDGDRESARARRGCRRGCAIPRASTRRRSRRCS